MDQAVQMDLSVSQQTITDMLGCAQTYYHDVFAPTPKLDEENVSMDDPGAGSSTDIGPLVTKGVFTAGLSELHKSVKQGTDMKQAVQDLRAMEAVTGVADQEMPVNTTFDNETANQNLYIAELVSARNRIQALEKMLRLYREELDQIKEIVGKDHLQVAADLRDAHQQCEQQMVELLRKPS